MSIIKEHYNSTLLSLDNKMNPELQVGDQVRSLYSINNLGLILKVLPENRCSVLWEKYDDPYSQLIGEPGYFYSPNIPLTVTLPGELNQISIDLKVGNE
jgi:hypothetical protein